MLYGNCRCYDSYDGGSGNGSRVTEDNQNIEVMQEAEQTETESRIQRTDRMQICRRMRKHRLRIHRMTAGAIKSRQMFLHMPISVKGQM